MASKDVGGKGGRGGRIGKEDLRQRKLTTEDKARITFSGQVELNDIKKEVLEEVKKEGNILREEIRKELEILREGRRESKL